MGNQPMEASNKDMANKWVIPIKEEAISSNNINRNKGMDNNMEIHMDNNSSNLIPMVVLIKVHNQVLQVKNKCHIMELHHNHNLMDLLDKKIQLKMLNQEKYLQVELVVQLNKIFTTISKNSDQSKIMQYKEIQ